MGQAGCNASEGEVGNLRGGERQRAGAGQDLSLRLQRRHRHNTGNEASRAGAPGRGLTASPGRGTGRGRGWAGLAQAADKWNRRFRFGIQNRNCLPLSGVAGKKQWEHLLLGVRRVLWGQHGAAETTRDLK